MTGRLFENPPSTPAAAVVLGVPQFGGGMLGGVQDGAGVASVTSWAWKVGGTSVGSSPYFVPLQVSYIDQVIALEVTYTTTAGALRTATTTTNPVSERVTGTSADDAYLAGGAGNDALDGMAGRDVAWYAGSRSDFTIASQGGGVFTVRDNSASGLDEGLDTVRSIERLRFADQVVALDIDGNAGQAYRVYQAAFDRKPDAGGLKYWVDQMDAGMSLATVAGHFVGSAEFAALYGSNPSHADFIYRLYTNVLHRPPEAAGYNWWLDQMNAGAYTRQHALAAFAESAENQAGVIGSIQNGIELSL